MTVRLKTQIDYFYVKNVFQSSLAIVIEIIIILNTLGLYEKPWRLLNRFSARNSGDLRTHSHCIFLSQTDLPSFTVRYFNTIFLALERRACIKSEKFEKLSYSLALIQVGLIFGGGVRGETSVVSE